MNIGNLFMARILASESNAKILAFYGCRQCHLSVKTRDRYKTLFNHAAMEKQQRSARGADFSLVGNTGGWHQTYGPW